MAKNSNMLIPLWREHMLKICMEAIYFLWLKKKVYIKLFTLCEKKNIKCELCCVILWDNCEREKKKTPLVNYWSNFMAAGRVIFCSSVIMSLCRVLTEMFYWIWYARTWLNPMHTFEMNENSDCQPDLITQHQCLISLMLVFKLEWIPTAMFQHLKPSQKSGRWTTLY